MKHGWRQCQARQDDAVLNLERGERRSGDQQQQPDGKTIKSKLQLYLINKQHR